MNCSPLNPILATISFKKKKKLIFWHHKSDFELVILFPAASLSHSSDNSGSKDCVWIAQQCTFKLNEFVLDE